MYTGLIIHTMCFHIYLSLYRQTAEAGLVGADLDKAHQDFVSEIQR